jgi:hypothetical protein
LKLFCSKILFIVMLMATITPKYLLAKQIAVEGYFYKKNAKEPTKTKIFIPIDANSKKIVFHKLQWSVSIMDAFTSIDIKYYPSDITEFGFKYNNIDYTYYSVPNVVDIDDGKSLFQDNKKIFLRVEVKGFCKLFTAYELPHLGNTIAALADNYHKVYCLKSNTKEWFVLKSFSFEQDLSDYFKDDAQIVEGIKTKVFNHSNVKELVATYNNNKRATK